MEPKPEATDGEICQVRRARSGGGRNRGAFRATGWLTLGIVASMATLHGVERPTPTAPAATWDTYRERFEVTQRSLTSLGAGSCASANCHAGAKPKPGEVFLGDEWNRWYDGGKGPHFRAYKVLYEDARSNVMASLLYGPGAVAKERAECLACHGLYVEESFRGRSYDLEDGVTCEACHGRSEKWQGPHQNPRLWRDTMTVEQRTAMGFYDTRDLIRRTENCLQCHLGTATRRVTHEMMAAGHPPLTFELVSDSRAVPKHWKDEQCCLTPEEGSYFHAREWVVGQLVTLRESMYRLAEWTRQDDRTDYALFDCYACHHDLNHVGWRQRRELQGSLGEPMFDLAVWGMCRPIVHVFAADQRERFAELVNTIVHHCVPRGGDSTLVREAALRLAAMTDELAGTMATTRIEEPAVRALLERLVHDRRFIGELGYRSATQALFAANALYCLARPAQPCATPESDEGARAIAVLHDHLFDENRRERASDYEPEIVIRQLDALGKILGQR